ncbi:MAG: phage major capsid protein [Nitrospira sp.]|nr:phage major capsid protein [Nitrospira sp.]
MPTIVLDDDLENLRPTLHAIDDDKLYAIQAKRDAREIAQKCDGQYSLTRMLNGLFEDNPRKLAPYELSCSERIAEEIGRKPRNGYLFAPSQHRQRRDLTASIASSGGYLVDVETAPGNLFTAFLFGVLDYVRLGITLLTLTRNAVFPKMTGSVTAGWLTNEGASLTESQMSFAVAAASPKSVGAYCEASDQILRQTSPAAQAFILRMMALATAAEVSAKLISGTGASGQLTGLLNVSGVGSVSGASATYGTLLDAVKNVEDASGIVDPSKAGFVLAPTDARLFRGRELAAGSGMIMRGNELGGYPAQVSKSVPNGSAIFADWSQLALLSWGVLEVGIDPVGVNSSLFKTGSVGIRSIWTCDSVCLHPESFQKIINIS